MPQFILQGAQVPEFETLDAFTRAYIEAAFFTEEERLTEDYNANMSNSADHVNSVAFPDLDPDTLAVMIADCAKFQADNAATLVAAYGQEIDEHVNRDMDEKSASHDFWLTRNGHGAGFWDGDWPEPYATQLDEAAKAFGECSLYVGDDQLIYAA